MVRGAHAPARNLVTRVVAWRCALRKDPGGIADSVLAFRDGVELLHASVDRLGEGLVLLHRWRVEYPHPSLAVGTQYALDGRISVCLHISVCLRPPGCVAAWGRRCGEGRSLQVYGVIFTC